MYFCDQKVFWQLETQFYLENCVHVCCLPGVVTRGQTRKISFKPNHGDQTWVKVFRISEFKMLNSADKNSFSNLATAYLKVFDHLTWNF